MDRTPNSSLNREQDMNASLNVGTYFIQKVPISVTSQQKRNIRKLSTIDFSPFPPTNSM